MTNKNYFSHRQIEIDNYSNFKLPKYLQTNLPESKEAYILDFGCGLGQTLRELQKNGYKNARGIDIDLKAIKQCQKEGLPCQAIKNLEIYAQSIELKYDFIIMSHVLEHFEKKEIIKTLNLLKNKLLQPKGKLLIMVPNAQSNTHSYWAYEDFTHSTIFTSGSILYVLKAAEFNNISFLDIDCTSSLNFLKRTITKLFLFLYKQNYLFWNKITGSSHHRPSPLIFSYEIKVLASND
jgi:2-polyprenyl-3-methyl-5-hydroxy-6-metoxy-1,4-benzoquinol methylase